LDFGDGVAAFLAGVFGREADFEAGLPGALAAGFLGLAFVPAPAFLPLVSGLFASVAFAVARGAGLRWTFRSVLILLRNRLLFSRTHFPGIRW
jgi:hypothetical protein